MTASRHRLWTDPVLGKRRGRAIPEPGMPPLPGVEQLDGLRDLAPRLLTGLVTPLMHQLRLQRPSDTFQRRVVIAIALPTHGRGHAKLPQGDLIRLGTLLRAAIRVVEQARAWALRPSTGSLRRD